MVQLDPRMRIGKAIAEPLEVHNIGSPKEREERVSPINGKGWFICRSG